jgi:hypothetical protein
VQGSGNKFTSAPWSIGAESVKPKATLRMTLPGVGKLTRGLTPVNDRSARTKLSGRRASNSATERKDTAYTDTTLRSFQPPSTAFLTYSPPDQSQAETACFFIKKYSISLMVRYLLNAIQRISIPK